MKYNDRLDNWVKNLIYYIKFGYLLILTNIDINHYLVTILVERWEHELIPSFATRRGNNDTRWLGLRIDGEGKYYQIILAKKFILGDSIPCKW